MLAVSIAVGWIVVRLVGTVDWAAVVDSLSRLSPWQVLPLAAALLMRQLFNAVPLAQFVPKLGIRRSLQNDLAANLIGTIAPPPGDVVLRVSMFRSWQIDPVDGMAGVTLNMLTFYGVRFLAPAIGLLFLAFQGLETGHVLAALGSAVVAAAMFAALALVVKGERLAALLGRSAGRVIARFRSSVDPDAWSAAVVTFRSRMSETIKTGLPRSMGALVCMVLSDGLILLLAVRFVGLGTDSLSLVDIFGAFLIAYPLTALPLAGFGVLDAALLATWTEIAGIDREAQIVAALMLWRVVTILGPLVLGGAVLLRWRSAHPSHSATQAPTRAADADAG